MILSRLLPFPLALALALPSLAADAGLLRMVMPEAISVAGIAVDRARNSPFGQFLLARIQQDENGLQKLAAQTGFDPRTDLTEIVVASTAPGAGALLVARGRFDIARITAAAQKAGATLETYKGVQLVVAPEANSHGRMSAVAFADPTLAIAGTLENLRAAIDRRNGPPALPATLASRLSTLSAHNHVWFYTTLPANSAVVQAHAGNVPLSSIQQVSGGFNLGDNVLVTAEAETRSAQDAAALADVIRFVAGNIQTNTGSNPHQQLATLLDSLEVSTAANVTRFTLTLPEQRLESLLRHAPRPARRLPPERHLD
jgi:hypothetical protein